MKLNDVPREDEASAGADAAGDLVVQVEIPEKI